MRKPRWALSGAHGAALLEAFAAEDWAALCGTKRDGGLLSALRAGGLGFGPDLRVASAAPADTIGALGFTGLAPFGLVLEALVGEKHLFASGEDKLGATIRALQDLIVEFHEPPP